MPRLCKVNGGRAGSRSILGKGLLSLFENCKPTQSKTKQPLSGSSKAEIAAPLFCEVINPSLEP